MRLIDADALKDKCYITVNGVTIGRNNYVMFHEIDDAPTIDVVSREHHDMEIKELKHQIKDQADMVSVVQCKDCIRNNDGNLCDVAYYINEDGDGFCNCGERREP